MSNPTITLRDGDTHDLRKSRGAFFTPAAIAEFIVREVMDGDVRSVLEPSCGEAAFLIAAGLHAREQGTQVSLSGIDIHQASARHAQSLLHDLNLDPHIIVSDFFDVSGDHAVDAVIGNPPFIRFHDHSGASRQRALAAAASAGVSLNELASSWAPFVAHATAFLRTGGHLGMVLPAEILHTEYAGPLREYILTSFRDVSLTLFDERVFPDVQEEVVLLIASGFRQGSSKGFEVRSVRNAEELTQPGPTRTFFPTKASARWTGAITASSSTEILSVASNSGTLTPLGRWGRVRLGAVTGSNKFFTMSEAEVVARGIPSEELLAISPPGSRHLRSLTLTTDRWRGLADAGLPCYLFRPGVEPSSQSAEKLQEGKLQEVDNAYKCRVRKLWWSTPVLDPPDLFLTYMNAKSPHLVTNSAGVRHLNSIHGVYIDAEYRGITSDLLPIAAFNSASAVSAELTGRSYGGGLLKLEPGEATRWLVPAAEVLNVIGETLKRATPDVERLLKEEKADEAMDIVDQIVLPNLGVNDTDQEVLRSTRLSLRARRTNRGKA